MKYKVYSIRDVKSGFGAPILDTSDESAIRGFSLAVSNGDNAIYNNYPQDFELYQIGSYETDSGKFDSILPLFLVNGQSCIIRGDSK